MLFSCMLLTVKNEKKKNKGERDEEKEGERDEENKGAR